MASRVGAPPFEVFSEVLAKLHSGASARHIARGGTGDRLKNIKFCLMEAKQERDRAFMQSDATMVLLRDERHGRLLLCSQLAIGTWRSDGVPRELCGTMALQPPRIWQRQ